MSVAKFNLRIVARAQYKGQWYDVTNLRFDTQYATLKDDDQNSLGTRWRGTMSYPVDMLDSIQIINQSTLVDS